MDLAFLIPVSMMAIPITAIIMAGKRKIAELRVEEARIQERSGGEGIIEELEGLRDEVTLLRSELGEMEERLDFAERLLTQSRAHGELPRGSSET